MTNRPIVGSDQEIAVALVMREPVGPFDVAGSFATIMARR